MAKMPAMFIEDAIRDAIRDAVRESYDRGYADGHEKGFEAGRQIFQSKWIGVEERLPDDHTRVLVAIANYDGWKINVAMHSDRHDIWYIGDMNAVGGKAPTYWMPLPDQPDHDKEET